MKSAIALAALLFGTVSALAQETLDTRVESLSIYNCSVWTSIRGQSGSGYGCSGYPFRENVAEYYSTSRALQEANRQIDDLTRRVEALEKRLSLAENQP